MRHARAVPMKHPAGRSVRQRLIGAVAVGALAVPATVGVVTLAASSASAHTGDLDATAVCNTQTGKYDVTYKLTISQTNEVGSTKWSVGGNTFAHTPTSNSDLPGTVQGTVASNGAQTITLGTISISGTSTQAPWAYAFTTWTPDNYKKGSDGGDITLKGDCKAPDKKDASAVVTVTPATCTEPAKAVLGATTNASWTSSSGLTGPGTYHAVATSDNGHLFPNGDKTKSFSGDLSGKITGDDCANKVVPTNPIIKGSCTVENHYGLPDDTSDIAYWRDGKDVTATIKSDNTIWGTLPDGWTKIDSTHAVWHFNAKDFPVLDCNTVIDNPIITPQSGCNVLSTITSNEGHWQVAETTYNEGHTHYSRTFVVDDGYVWSNGQTELTLEGDLPAEVDYQSTNSEGDCYVAPSTVVPTNPIVKDKCGTVDDHYGLPDDTSDIAYWRDGKDVTATIKSDNTIWGTLPAGWVKVDSTHATYPFGATNWDTTPCLTVIDNPVVTPQTTCGVLSTVTVSEGPWEVAETTYNEAHTHYSITVVATGDNVFASGKEVTLTGDLSGKVDYQDTNEDSPCYVTPPHKDDTTTTSEGQPKCGVATVDIYETTTTYTFDFDSTTGTFSEPIAHVGEPVLTGTRPVTKAELDELDCPLVPGGIQARCVGNIPYLAYALSLPAGFPDQGANPVTVTFSGGTHTYTLPGKYPLSGTVLWPGANVDPAQWPGWTLDGKSPTDDPSRFDWTRHGVQVTFEVNPQYATTVTYPAATSVCANPPASTPTPPPFPPNDTVTPPPSTPPTLASTGSNGALPTALMALGLVLIGGGATYFVRRQRKQTSN